MVRKIQPVNVKNVIKRNRISKKQINVGMVGVFDSPHSSCVFFTKGFREIKSVKKVFELDYRKCTKLYGLGRLIQEIINLSRKVDLLIIAKGNGIPIQAIKNSCQYTTVFLWFPDWAPQLMNNKGILDYSKYCHYRCATGFEVAEVWSELINLPVYHILDGVDPTMYYPVNEQKEYDVVFIGGKDTERSIIYQYIKSKGHKVKFFGPGFTNFVKPPEFRTICSKSKIVLNLSRSDYSGYSSLRLWTCLACGTFVLTKKIPDLTKHMGLVKQKHIDEFDSLIELDEKIKYYIKNSDNRQAIEKEAIKFIKENRTWRHTAQDILQVVYNEQSLRKDKTELTDNGNF